jgi:hypothetical protein
MIIEKDCKFNSDHNGHYFVGYIDVKINTGTNI